MQIALLSDVHANLPALQAVLPSAQQADAIVFCGDLIGYYAHPNEVCQLVQSLNASAIRGNHEAFILGAVEGPADEDAFYRAQWTRDTLTRENRQWLAALPTTLEFDLQNTHLIVRHASPWDERTYLNADSPRIAEIHLNKGEVLAVGHTHRSMVVEAGQGLVVNPGAVGQPRDGFPDASFALLDTLTGKVDIQRISYDHAQYAQELASRGWNHRAIALLTG